MDLSFKALGVTLGGREVLRDVSAVLRPGKITAILGPNGAGKSSLVKAAAGLLPVTGSATIGGRAVAELHPGERARLIGYLPQDPAVHWNVTAAEAVALGRMPHRSPFAALGKADEAAIAKAFEATETRHLTDRPIAELSGGERARALLARVLAGEPAWLLADEPLAALDPAHQIDLLARLSELARGGMGVVVVLHDLVQASRAADDVLLLKDGRLVAHGPADAVMLPEQLQQVFGIHVLTVQENGRRLCVPIGRA